MGSRHPSPNERHPLQLETSNLAAQHHMRSCQMRIISRLKMSFVGHTPSTAGISRKKFRKNSRKTPETLSERFLEFPSRVRLGCPKPYNSRHFGFQSVSRILSPPVRLGTPLFSELVPERASQSRSWNSRQYWGYF